MQHQVAARHACEHEPHLQQVEYVTAQAAPGPSAQRVQQQQALQRVTRLHWRSDAVQQALPVLWPI